MIAEHFVELLNLGLLLGAAAALFLHALKRRT